LREREEKPMRTVRHYRLVTDSAERIAFTSSDLQDDAIACEHQGILYAAFVVFEDGSSLPFAV
jgi:hypothetical protein